MRKVAIASLLVVLAACRHRENSASANPAPNKYETKLQPLLEEVIRRQELPGLAIAVVDGGKVVYAKGFGVLSLDRQGAEPVTPRSLFHMASITKPFVATAVMQLVEKGRMRLDAPITTYLPYFEMSDPRAKTITIAQLLSHTSGMPDVGDYEWDKPQYDDGALERFVRSLKPLALIAAPGDRYQYSNMGFEILGDAVAKASGMTFEQYVDANILGLLGMSDSTLLVKETDAALMTWGHELDARGKPAVSKVYPYNRKHTPSSNLHSNVLDMSRWAIANLQGGELDGKRILEVTTRDQMWTPTRDISAGSVAGDDVRRQAIGFSWFLGKHRGRRMVSHGGGDTGYLTDLVLLPDDGKAVVWMTNVDYIDPTTITRAALDVALGLEPQPITAKRSAGRVLISTYKDGGFDAALAQYASIKANQTDLYALDDSDLNDFGYHLLLVEKKTPEALRVFRLNVETFPKSANAHDSLGEALEIAGDDAGARAAYEAALRVDPDFTHARDALKKLGS